MFRHLTIGLTFLTFSFFGLRLIAQPNDKPATAAATKLPIKRIVLTNSGIGHYHREGTVNGTARVDLKVSDEEVNDLILTLLAADAKGTHRSIAYDNRAPAEVTLKAFRVDLAVNPSIGMLLTQVRGEKIEIASDERSTVVGSIVSVETPGEESKKPELVNLMSEDGLMSVPIAKIRKVKFLKPELQAEFKLALEALAAARNSNAKTVGVTYHGVGERNVSLDYTSETPLWKPTYRLVLDGNAGTLHGLAAVENTTEEDWENVEIRLSSGRPITFKMDLYDPLFVPRPTVEVELYASLRPTLYQGQVTAAGFGGGFAGNLGGQLGIQGAGQSAGVLGAVGNAQNLGQGGGVAGLQGGGQLGQFGNYYGGNKLSFEEFQKRAAVQSSVKLTASPMLSGANLGESFEYAIKDPVSLPRFKSALLPFLQEKIDTQRVSVYNPAILVSYPQSGLYLKNNTKQFIAQGPVTVFEGDRSLGQARLSDVKPGDSRLLTFAIDLDVAIKEEEVPNQRTPVTISLKDGMITTLNRIKTTKRFNGLNKSGQAKTVWITQPRVQGWKLLSPEKPAETTPDLYRFELKLDANAKGSVDIVQEFEETRNEQTTGFNADTADVSVKEEQIPNQRTPLSMTIKDGKLTTVTKVKTTRRFFGVNKGDTAKTVSISLPRFENVKLLTPEKPAETTAVQYRFELQLAANAKGSLDVIQELEETDKESLSALSIESLNVKLENPAANPAVKEALGKLKALLVEREKVLKANAAESTALKEIVEEQTRLRANLATVPKDSDAYKRYVKKFDDQETEIEKRRAAMKELDVQIEKFGKDIASLIKDLKA